MSHTGPGNDPAGRRRAARAILAAAFLLAIAPPRAGAQGGVRGPIVQFNRAQIDFDTAYCGTTKRIGSFVTNIGDAPTLLSVGTPAPAPFSTDLPASVLLRPGDTLGFNTLFAPDHTGPFSRTLTVGADSRRPVSFCLLLDVSMSMNQMDIRDTAGGLVTRLRAAREVCASTIGGMVGMRAGGIVDSGAVVRFADAGDFARLREFTDDKQSLLGAIPDTAWGMNTCLYDAMIRAVALTAPRTGVKVLLVVTDGQNTCSEPPSAQEVIAAARQAGVRVYAVGLGNPDSTALMQIASATQGGYSSMYSLAGAGDPFRAIVSAAGAGNSFSLPISGAGVAPRISATLASIACDTVQVGGEAWRDVDIRNDGTAPFTGNVGITPSEFRVSPGTIVRLQPGGESTVRVYYHPSEARADRGSLRVTSSLPECEPNPVTIPCTGAGSIPLTLRLAGDVRGKPGSTVVFPVLLSTLIPSSAGVADFRFSLRYNRSMLYPLSSYFGGEEASLLQSAASATHATRFDGQEAITTYTFTGASITSDRSDRLLCRPAFQVLMGNALATDVRLEDGVTNNPLFPSGVSTSLRFTADSLCDQDRRLINSSALYSTGMAQSSPNPVSSGEAGGVTLRYSLASHSFVRLLLVDALGRTVRTLVSEEKPAGEYSCPVPTAGLPPGTYLYLFEAGALREIRKMLVQP